MWDRAYHTGSGMQGFYKACIKQERHRELGFGVFRRWGSFGWLSDLSTDSPYAFTNPFATLDHIAMVLEPPWPVPLI